MPSKLTAVLGTLGITAAAFGLPYLFRKPGSSHKAEDEFYESENTPGWAPPSWAFPVAWSINTVVLAWATQYLYLRSGHPRRRQLLGLLGAHWAVYATFERAYFGERSPVLAAVWTSADFAICHLAFYRALGVNRSLAAAWVPVNLWLTLALPLSIYQLTHNEDPRFGTAGIALGEDLAAMLGVAPPRVATRSVG